MALTSTQQSEITMFAIYHQRAQAWAHQSSCGIVFKQHDRYEMKLFETSADAWKVLNKLRPVDKRVCVIQQVDLSWVFGELVLKPFTKVYSCTLDALISTEFNGRTFKVDGLWYSPRQLTSWAVLNEQGIYPDKPAYLDYQKKLQDQQWEHWGYQVDFHIKALAAMARNADDLAAIEALEFQLYKRMSNEQIQKQTTI